MVQKQPMVATKPYQPTYEYGSTQASSAQNTSAEFLPFARSQVGQTMRGQQFNNGSRRGSPNCSRDSNGSYGSSYGSSCSRSSAYELPSHLAQRLSAEDLEIIKQVDALVFDQAGCRMLQRKLEDEYAAK